MYAVVFRYISHSASGACISSTLKSPRTWHMAWDIFDSMTSQVTSQWHQHGCSYQDEGCLCPLEEMLQPVSMATLALARRHTYDRNLVWHLPDEVCETKRRMDKQQRGEEEVEEAGRWRGNGGGSWRGEQRNSARNWRNDKHKRWQGQGRQTQERKRLGWNIIK